MSAIAKIYSMFQAENPETFNEDLISMREQERKDLHSYFQDVFNSLNFSGIKYLYSETITDESEFHKYITQDSINIEDSRLDLIRAKFSITAEEETKEVWLNVFFPKIVDKYFFKLKGSTYNAVYQINDRNFYPSVSHNDVHAIFLKSLLMPLGVHALPKEKVEYVNGNTGDIESIPGHEFVLDFFKRKKSNTYKNMFYYFFIKFGIESTISKFFEDDNSYVKLINLDEGESISYEPGFGYIRIRDDFYIRFVMLDGKETLEYQNLITTLYFAFKGIRRNSSIDDDTYWKKKILNSPTGNINKADKAIFSLERVLDNRTKRNLMSEIGDEEICSSIYNVIHWMTYNFHSYLQTIDMVDLENRRLRLYEYMLYPLLRKLSDASYRILNSRKITIKRLNSVFSNIGPNYIVRGLLTNELFRYSNSSSSMDFFQSLKFSACGPQAVGAENATLKFKTVHPSYVGVLGLNTASSTDPGLTGTITPMTKEIENMQFKFHSDRKPYSTPTEAFILSENV